MARISTYANDTSIQLTDKLLGTDNIDLSTKNFQIADILAFLLGNGTENYLPIYNDTGTLQDSVLYQDSFSNPTLLSTSTNFQTDGEYTATGTVTFNSKIVLSGEVYDADGVIGNNEQVLVSDSNGNVKWENYQGSGLEYQAAWDANTDTPDLTAQLLDASQTGKYWIVSIAGNTALPGSQGNITDWQPGDWAIISEDSAGNVFWDKIDNTQTTVGALVSAMGGTALNYIMVPESQIGSTGGNLYFKGSGGTTADPLRIDTQITGASGGAIDIALDLVTPDAMIGKLGTFSNPSSITVGKGGVIDDIVAGSADGVTGTGTLNAVAKFDAAGSVIGSSSIIDNGTNIGLGRNANVNFAVDMGDAQAGGLPIAIRNGLIISNNPTLPQVDNTSVIIGAGSNDIIAGSDHSLTVGNGNQIQLDSDCTITTGTNNAISNSNNSIIGGSGNSVTDSNNAVVEGVNNKLAGLNNSIVLGNSNTIESDVGGGSHFVYGINNDIKASGTSNTPTNCFTLGSNIDITSTGGDAHRNMFSIGFDLTPVSETMTLGYDNNTATYPAPGTFSGTIKRGPVKFAVNTYVDKTASTKNALLITEGSEAQFMRPQIVMPNLTDQEASAQSTATATGTPDGGLYHNGGFVRIVQPGLTSTDISVSKIKFNSDGVTNSNYEIEAETSADLVIKNVNNSGDVRLTGQQDLKVEQGEVRIELPGKGLILTSPDGKEYEVTVSNAGALSVSAV